MCGTCNHSSRINRAGLYSLLENNLTVGYYGTLLKSARSEIMLRKKKTTHKDQSTFNLQRILLL